MMSVAIKFNSCCSFTFCQLNFFLLFTQPTYLTLQALDGKLVSHLQKVEKSWLRSIQVVVKGELNLQSCRILNGSLVTVLGDVDPKELGRTLTHEHLSMNFWLNPKEKSEAEWKLKNLYEIQRFP